MDKNTFFAIFLSTAFLIVWFMFFQPKPAKTPEQTGTPAAVTAVQQELAKTPSLSREAGNEFPEQELTVETDK